MWQQLSAEDAVARGYASVGSHEHTFWNLSWNSKKRNSKTSYFQL